MIFYLLNILRIEKQPSRMGDLDEILNRTFEGERFPDQLHTNIGRTK